MHGGCVKGPPPAAHDRSPLIRAAFSPLQSEPTLLLTPPGSVAVAEGQKKALLQVRASSFSPLHFSVWLKNENKKQQKKKKQRAGLS